MRIRPLPTPFYLPVSWCRGEGIFRFHFFRFSIFFRFFLFHFFVFPRFSIFHFHFFTCRSLVPRGGGHFLAPRQSFRIPSFASTHDPGLPPPVAEAVGSAAMEALGGSIFQGPQFCRIVDMRQ